MIKRKWFVLRILCWLFLPLLVMSCKQEEKMQPYQDPNLPVEQRVEDLLSRMSLKEKIAQLSGKGFDTLETERPHIPALRMSDGPMGVRWGYATAFPAAVAIAAAWNPGLAEKIGAAIAVELKSKDRNYLLGPCVNIHRHPLGGRNFESYGEDPFLAARMAVAFIKGVQSQGVLACAKHYACNNQEWERHKVDVTIDERGLREIYLPAFKAAVKEAGVWTVMAAYNRFRGEHCSENSYLLNDILKKEWGFQGFVVSDWGGTYHTVRAANGGLDLEMPWGKFFGEKLLEAVKNGEVSKETIDDKIRRLMRVRFEAGLFGKTAAVNKSVIYDAGHKLLAREAAQESIVLLKNKNNVLPLDRTAVKTLAVIGPNAVEARSGGGGSSKVTPLFAITPLEALQNALPDEADIKYGPGIAIRGDILPLGQDYLRTGPPDSPAEEEGLAAEYFANMELQGSPVLERTDSMVNFNWGYDAPHPGLHQPDDRNLFSVRWSGRLLPPKTGIYKLNVIHNDGIRVYLDNRLIIDNWKKNRVVFRSASVPLTAGQSYSIRIEYFFNGGISLVKFGWELPGHDTIAEAVELAKQSDAAIIFAGLHERFESEAHDRARLELPNQDVLIKAVSEVNPNTIVVIETGGPILMTPWLDQTAAVIQAWYPGQEGADAIAAIILGDINPSGKLPVSFIKSYDDSPAFNGYKDKSLKSHYGEGIFVGYRYLDKHRIEPQFPFGHGLSYTRFEYGNLAVQPVNGKDNEFTVSVDIKNIGARQGGEVVQVYVKDVQSALERPERELKGFEKVFLEPGESRAITIKLDREAFSYYDPRQKQWLLEPGEFEIHVGSSSRDIRLIKKLTIAGGVKNPG